VQLRDLDFGQGEDGHACKAERLEQAGEIGLLAADPVQRLGEEDINRT